MKKLNQFLTTVVLLLVIVAIPIMKSDAVPRVPPYNTLADYLVRLNAKFIGLYTQTETTPQERRVVKFGENLDVGTAAAEDLWSYGGLMVFSTNTEPIVAVSDDSEDDFSTGNGARTLLVTCIGDDGTEEDITMLTDGTSSVRSGDDEDCQFVNRAVVVLSSTTQQNAGDITITNATSGQVLAHIPAGYGVTQQAVYKVPADERCYIDAIEIEADKLSGSSPRVTFLIKVFNPDITNTEYIIRRELIDTTIESSKRFPDFKDQALLPGEIISIEVETTVNNTQVQGEIYMTCRKIS